MNIIANITGIKYKLYSAKKLERINFQKFNINSIPTSCIIENENINLGISKWVSPKRTRSYPFERIYNTLSTPKRITVIPIIKDEGVKGDRDFLQWDTVSLMSLLDVYVILSYYQKAEKHKTRINKITNQQFDNNYIKNKINEINNYHSSALHWNLKEIKESLPNLIKKVKKSYSILSNKLDVKFHNEEGINKFQNQFINGVDKFMNTSRKKAQEAQNRERKTIQPKESLSTLSKATITIKNYLGGIYYLTTDEIEIKSNKLFLIEDKHSTTSKLPSLSNIRDGLLKMILYTNLEKVFINNKAYRTIPILKLTSSNLISSINSNSNNKKFSIFLKENSFTDKQILIIENLFKEAKDNNFVVSIEKAN